MIPDALGNMHLVDIKNYDVDEIVPAFNAFNDVVFRLFTRSNPTTPQVIVINNHAQLINSNFNVAHPSRFQIHGNLKFHSFEKSVSNFKICLGWNGGGHAGTGAAVRNAYLERGDFNVFTVDWVVLHLKMFSFYIFQFNFHCRD